MIVCTICVVCLGLTVTACASRHAEKVATEPSVENYQDAQEPNVQEILRSRQRPVNVVEMQRLMAVWSPLLQDVAVLRQRLGEPDRTKTDGTIAYVFPRSSWVTVWEFGIRDGRVVRMYTVTGD